MIRSDGSSDRKKAAAATGVRWWPELLLLGATLAALIWIWTTGDRIGQERVMLTLGVFFLALVGTLFWALLLSRLPRRIRWSILGLAAILVVLIANTVRIRGVTGNLVPLLSWRWSEATWRDPGPSEARRGSLSDAYRDFPQFLGPDRNGVLPGPALATDWSETPPIELWRRPVGEAWSSFAIQDGLAVTQEQRGEEESIVAYDLALGEPVWAHSYPARYSTTIGGTGPRATPTIDDGRVYAVGATGILTALALADGALLWSRSTTSDHGGSVPEWGKSGSPLVVGERVIVSTGGSAGHSLAAYDRTTGEPVWSAGSDASGYSSPLLTELGGVGQIVIFNQRSVAGHDALTGRLLWQQEWPAEQPNVAQPLPLGKDRLLVSSGYGVGSKLLQIERRDDDSWSSSVLWESPRMKAKFTNLVSFEGSVYGLDDGVLVCLDPETGKRRWKRGRYGHGQILLVGRLLLILTEKGELVLVEPSPEEQRELTRYPVFDGKTWNPPALAGDYLLLRNERQATGLRLPLE